MGIRFRRSFRLAPGVRLNLSASGLSATVGPRGASMNFGSRGAFLNTGIPGTGLYSRERIDSHAARRSARTAGSGSVRFSGKVSVSDDGDVTFLDSDGQPLSPRLVNVLKRQKGDEIREYIQERCEDINELPKQLGEIHLHTPNPTQRIRYEPEEFDPPAPKQPRPKRHGILGWLFKSVRRRIDFQNETARADYEKRFTEWRTQEATFHAAEADRKRLLEERVYTDVDAMEAILENALKSLTWPRETNVSAEVRDGGELVMLDVDLPEIEDMPKTNASYHGRGYRITMKELTDKQCRRLYLEHVHAVGFRIIGEAFAVVPKALTVILSAYSQRPNKATGVIDDEYLYSVKVQREAWTKINFDNLSSLDIVAALSRFDLRCDVSKTGVFTPIEPILAPA